MPGKKVKLPLSVTNPDLATMAFGWSPALVSHGSRQKLEWVCAFGHHTFQSPRDKISSNSKLNCKICSGQEVQIGTNDLQTTDPEIAAQAYEWDPQTVTRGSNKKKKWICPDGHIYESVIANRTLSGVKCRICGNQIVQKGFNDLASKNPEIALEADGWDASKFVFGSTQRKNWKCKNEHKWVATIVGRTQGNKKCPYCTNSKTWPGFNDLATTHPHLIDEADGWDPTQVHAGTNKKLGWVCKNGHQWQASGTSRSAENTGCPVCKNRIVKIGFNDLKTTHPELSKEAFGWDPQSVVSGNNQKFKWKCQNGHTWTAGIVNRAHGKETSCPTCAKFGYDVNSEAFLYFLSHPRWRMLQIGITNVPDSRLPKHKKNGWELVEIRGPIDGLLAREWESAILRMLEAKGADLSNGKIAGKFDGYSEAWSKSTFEVKSIKELMRLTEEFEADGKNEPQ